jgi:hypothetical protein
MGIRSRYAVGTTVSIGHVQRFSGALEQANHQVGTYITSSAFSGPAVETAESLQIHLVDGETLAEELIELVDQLLIRASYDDHIRRFLSMASKRAVLKTTKDPADLESNPEYNSLKTEMDELSSQMAEDLSDLDESGFDALFRDLS